MTEYIVTLNENKNAPDRLLELKGNSDSNLTVLKALTDCGIIAGWRRSAFRIDGTPNEEVA